MTPFRLGPFLRASSVVGLLPLLATAAFPVAEAAALAESSETGSRGSRPPYMVGEVVSRVSVRQPLVALTFDDGPREPYTSAILDVLADQGVKATFFLIGENAARHPEVVRRIVRDGHAIGNHSWSHPRLGSAADATVRDEIARTDELLERLTGVRTTLFRPPYGDIGRALGGWRGVPAQRGHLLVMWSVEVRDWATRSALDVAVGTLRRVEPGAIVLLHDGGGDREHTVRATRWMVGRLARQGYELVTVPELLAAGVR